MSSLKPGDLVQKGAGNGSVPYLYVKESEKSVDKPMLLLKELCGPAAGQNVRWPASEVYLWPQGTELVDAMQKEKVEAVNQIVTETKEVITEAAAAHVKEDPDAAPYIDRLLAEVGCPPREKRYTATLTVSVTIEFGTKFDETTPKLVENSLHISDDEDCIHIMHDADLVDMTLAHSLSGIRVQKLEEK